MGRSTARAGAGQTTHRAHPSRGALAVPCEREDYRAVPRIHETVDQILSTLTEIDSLTIERDPRATVLPPSMRTPSSAPIDVERRLDLGKTIGEGGMGIVRLGMQRALGREVAVKGLKPEHKTEPSAQKLVREAQITGRLEHPNVIPVYDIAEEADGTPLILLKKIEGDDWATLMHDRAVIAKRFRTDDPLEWNLRIFMQVCNTMSYAHSRGVLHRDLKPENVMIGRFGEVYVVDWGLAVGLDPEPGSPLPPASDALDMAGTPAYMAPEMVGGAGYPLTVRTDVYLLGATLFEIVAGRPPHEGNTVREIVASILLSEPRVPSTVPEDLARIVRRALDPDPDARFEQAEQLRLAVEGFLRHRSARELARHAEARLALLLERIEEKEIDRDAVYRLYGECRFGLRHALEMWPEDESVRSSADLATVRMVELELRLGDPQAARVLLRDLDRVSPELDARVSRALAAKDADYAELRRLRDDLDPEAGRRLRQITFVIFSVVWVLWPLGAELLRVRLPDHFNAESGALASAATLAVVLVVLWWLRRTLAWTAINRRLGVAVVLTATLELVWDVVAMHMNTSLIHGLHERLLTASAILTMMAASVNGRLMVAACAYLFGYLLLAWIGVERVFYVTSLANLVLFANLYFVLTISKGASERRASFL
jgi:eukaryotic-like serine/threonine-protein kinase